MTVRASHLVIGSAFILGGLCLAAGSLWFVRFDKRGVDEKIEGKTVIRFAAWGAKQETAELRQRVVNRINSQAEDFFVKLEPIPSDYNMKLATMIAGGYAPDIFYIDPSFLVHYAALGALMDLSRLVEADHSAVCDLGDYFPSILGAYRWNEGLWALPWISQPVILYCNRDLFDKAGVPLPDKTWNWDTFLEAAEEISEYGRGLPRPATGFVLQPGWPPYEMFVWQNGGRLLEGNRVTLCSEPALEAARFLQHLLDSGAAPPLDVVSERGISNLFRDGRVGMFMGGAADDLDRLEGLDVIACEVPKGPAGVRVTYAWHAGLCISADTNHPELAFEAWRALLEAIQHWKIAPPRRSLKPLIEQIEPRKAPAADVIRRSMEYMRPIALIREQKTWESLIYRRFKEPLLRSEKDPAELAREVEPLLQELVE